MRECISVLKTMTGEELGIKGAHHWQAVMDAWLQFHCWETSILVEQPNYFSSNTQKATM